MSEIKKSVQSAFNVTKDYRIDTHIVEQGSPSLITGIYPAGSDIVKDFYKKPDITATDGTTKSAKVYGEVLITPFIVDSGVSTSTNDPSSVLKTIRFHMGNGETEGVVPGPNGSNMENVYLVRPNQIPQPVINSDGRPSTGDVLLASTLGGLVTSAPKIWDAIKASTPSASKAPQIDPVTGKPIPSTSAINTANAAKGVNFDSLGNVNLGGKGQDYIPAWNPATSTWLAKSPNELVAGVFSGSTIVGGTGGTGGIGGTGGTGGSGAGSGASTGSGKYTSSNTSFGTQINTTAIINGHDIEVGYYDSALTSHSIGTILGTQYVTSGVANVTIFYGLVTDLYKAQFKNSNLSVIIGASYPYSYSVFLETGNGPTSCMTIQYINGWLKDAGTLITTIPVTPSPCAPCIVKYSGNKIRTTSNVVVSTTANISATKSIVSRVPTAPNIDINYSTYSSSPLGLYVTDFTVNSGGGAFYQTVPLRIPATNSSGSSFDYPAVASINGSHQISSVNLGSGTQAFKSITTPVWAIQSWKATNWNGSQYLMIGSGSDVSATSPTGVTWTQGTMPSSSAWNDVAWNGAVYCAVSGSTVGATSPDGITWTSRTLPGSATHISWNGSVFCAISTSTTAVWTSPDGITWTTRTVSFAFAPNRIVWNGSLFLITTSSYHTYTSPTGTTWTLQSGLPIGITGGPLAWNGTVFINIDGNSTSAAYSSNGTTWTSTTLPNSGTWSSVAWNGTRFVLPNQSSGGSLHSTDGITWTSGQSGVTNASTSNIVSNGSEFFIIKQATAIPYISSSGGTTWTAQTAIASPTTVTESVPNGYGYDPTTTTKYFGVPIQTRRLTVSAFTVLNGVTLAAGDLILVKNQTDATENGIYEYINSTTLDLIYELCYSDFARNGIWVHVTGGTTNSNTDWLLDSTDITVYQLTDPMSWVDVTASTDCDIVPGAGGGGGGSAGSSGSSGGSGSAGSPGTTVTISSTPDPSPTIALANPCTTTYGTIDSTTSDYALVSIPALATLTSNTTPTTVTLLYTVTTGDGVWSVNGSLTGVTATIGTRTISLVGTDTDVLAATGQIRFKPPISAKDEIVYQVLVTNSKSKTASQVCSVMPLNLVQKTNTASCSTITITAASGSDTGKIQISTGTSTLFSSGTTKDLTNGYVPFNTSLTQTAADFVTNINANVAVKHALATTDAAWLPLYTASSSGAVIRVCGPSAGGGDFNGVTLSGLTTGSFAFSGSNTFLGGLTANVSDYLNKIPGWSAISSVLGTVAGSVLGAVVTNIIMNKSSQLDISIPNEDDISVAFLYRGAKVQIPNEYTSPFSSPAYSVVRSGHPTYAGFSGVYKTAYTNNPAWIAYDHVKNLREGLGSYLPLTAAQDTLLIQDVFTIAQYCDELVAGVSGTMKNRFSTNTVITDGSRMQVLEQLCSVFLGGYVFWNGGIRFTADRPDSEVKLLVNQENCSAVSEQLASAQTFINKVRLQYVEPENFYNAEVVVAENTEAIQTWGEKVSDIVAFGCTDSDEAIRRANHFLLSQKENAQIFNYMGSVDHYALVPGDIVQYEDPLERGARYSGRVKSVTGTAVVLDAAIAAVAGDYFSVTNNDGTIHNTTIASVSGVNLVMNAASAGTVSPWATFIAADTTIGKRLYKVIKSDETSLGEYAVTLQFYSLDKFVTSTQNSIPSVPAQVTVVDKSNTYVKLTWNASTQTTGPGIAGYYVYRNGNTTTPYATLGNVLTYTDSGVSASTTYTYQIAAFSSDAVALVSVPSAVVTTFTKIGFYAIASNPTQTMQVSSNGTSWTAATMPGGVNRAWSTPRSGLGIMVSLVHGTNIGAYSTNGTTWTQITLPVTSTTQWVYDYNREAASGAGQFVAVDIGSTNAMYSTDGITWSATTNPQLNTTSWLGPVYGNGTWMISSRGSAYALTSKNGITWTLRTLPMALNWQAPTFGNGVFSLVSTTTQNVSLSTVDGSVWTTGTLPSLTFWQAATFAQGKFISLANSTTSIATSTDAINWTGSSPLPGTSGWVPPMYGNGTWLARATTGTALATSPDGVTWTSHTLPVSHTIVGGIFAAGKFILAFSGTTDVCTSADGITWTTSTLSAALSYVGVVYA